MVRSEAVAIVARLLNLNPGRCAALGQRAAEDGMLPVARGRAVPQLSQRDLAMLFLACVTDNGLGRVPQSIREFSALETESGIELSDVITNIFAGLVEPAAYVRGGLIFRLRPAGATLIVNDVRLTFGAAVPEDSVSTSVVVPGATLAALAFEFRGYSRSEAEAEIVRLIGAKPTAANAV
ncbi:hypothetical protein ABIA00_006214 [Bradyrhizobium ottawaense]|uniref:hypothetical protein n=1 Tax=Bradyrhizobium ottawaense TaxID=931866 RepID=UPI0038362D6D